MDINTPSHDDLGLQLVDVVAGEVRNFFRRNPEALTENATLTLVTGESSEPLQYFLEFNNLVHKIGGSLGDPQSLNRYAYVENSPTNSIDPSGMNKCWPGVGVVLPCEDGGFDVNTGGDQLLLNSVGFGWGGPIGVNTSMTIGDDGSETSIGDNGQIISQQNTTSASWFSAFDNFDTFGGIFATSFGDQVLIAARALEKPNCRKLFVSTVDPGALLLNLAWGTSGSIIAANLGSDGPTAMTNQVLAPQLVETQDRIFRQSAFAAQITLNTTASPIPDAATIIHELGHAVNLLYGDGASAIFPDNNTTSAGRGLSRINRILVLSHCFGSS